MAQTTTETEILRRHAHGFITKVDRAAREIEMIVTRQEVDGDGEVIVTRGVDLARYSRNPIVLRQHDHTRGVARMASLVLTTVHGADALVGRAVLVNAEVAAEVEAGVLNGASVGFRSLERGAPILPGQTGPTHVRTELVEISLVVIPSCSSCTVIAKALGGARLSHEPLVLDQGTLTRLIRQQIARTVDERMPILQRHLERALRRATGKVD